MDEPILPGTTGADRSVEIEQLIRALVDAGAVYVAVSEGPLPHRVHLLVDGAPASRKRCFAVLENVDTIHVDEHQTPLTYDDALARTTHNRVPLYVAEGHKELAPVDPDTGAENLRRAGEGNWDVTPPRDQTAPLYEVVDALVDAGAISVTACRDMLGYSNKIDLRVGLPAETVYEIAGRYEAVTFDDETYRFHIEPLMIGGPQGEALRVGLYYEENISGIEPKSIEEGLDDLRSFIDSDYVYPRPAADY